MLSDKINLDNIESLWQSFAQRNSLDNAQINQFKIYYELLIKTNEQYNLTSITELESVLNLHFEDSLALSHCINLNEINTLADVGTGGGFPAIPLKIKFPNLKLILIEVIGKKRIFLQELVKTFNFSDVKIIDLDWRNFLRNTDYDIDLFCARASLQPEELLRALKQGSKYNNATIVYWASESWVASEKEKPLIIKDYWYNIGNKKRHLVFFKRQQIS